MWFKNLNFLNAAVTDLGHFILSLSEFDAAQFFYFHSPNELVRRIPARCQIQVSEGEESKRRDAAENVYGAISAHHPHHTGSKAEYAMHRHAPIEAENTKPSPFFIAGGKNVL